MNDEASETGRAWQTTASAARLAWHVAKRAALLHVQQRLSWQSFPRSMALAWVAAGIVLTAAGVGLISSGTPMIEAVLIMGALALVFHAGSTVMRDPRLFVAYAWSILVAMPFAAVGSMISPALGAAFNVLMMVTALRLTVVALAL